MNITHLLANDPQRLVDDGTKFQIKASGQMDWYTVSLVDGCAAGGPWVMFHFWDGPFEGTEMWFCGWEAEDGFLYLADTSDDGFMFNPKVPSEDMVPGNGACVPLIHGTTFWLAPC